MALKPAFEPSKVLVLEVVLAVIAPRNGELGSPGRSLGVREDGVDLRIGGQKVFHSRHGRVANPLSIASRQDLDIRVFGEDVLHALSRSTAADEPLRPVMTTMLPLPPRSFAIFSATPSAIVTLL